MCTPNRLVLLDYRGTLVYCQQVPINSPKVLTAFTWAHDDQAVIAAAGMFAVWSRFSISVSLSKMLLITLRLRSSPTSKLLFRERGWGEGSGFTTWMSPSFRILLIEEYSPVGLLTIYGVITLWVKFLSSKSATFLVLDIRCTNLHLIVGRWLAADQCMSVSISSSSTFRFAWQAGSGMSMKKDVMWSRMSNRWIIDYNAEISYYSLEREREGQHLAATLFHLLLFEKHA